MPSYLTPKLYVIERYRSVFTKIFRKLRRDKTNLFYRPVIAWRRKYNQHLFQKATGKLRKTLRSSSQATTLLSKSLFMSVSCMVFITLPKWVASFWRFHKKKWRPVISMNFLCDQSRHLLNYIMKECANCLNKIFDVNICTKIIESFCIYSVVQKSALFCYSSVFTQTTYHKNFFPN